jgi:hypothetical protein
LLDIKSRKIRINSDLHIGTSICRELNGSFQIGAINSENRSQQHVGTDGAIGPLRKLFG